MSFEKKNLGEICDFQGGAQPPKSAFVYEPKEGYIRFLQIRDFGSEKNHTYIPISKKNKTCSADEIMIGRYGASVGKILRGRGGAYNVALMKATPVVNLINKHFFWYYLNSAIFQDDLRSVASRSAQNGFSKDDIFNFKVPLPPLATQQKIVAKLDAVFAEIDKSTAAAQSNAGNADTYFSNFLDELINSFDIKSVKKIEDVCDLYQGLAINKKSSYLLVDKSSLPLLRIKDLKSGSSEQYIAESGFPKNSLVHENEIIYTRTGSLGLVFMGRYGILHNNSFKVIPRTGIDNKFLFWWLQSSKFKKKIMSLALKAAQPDISHKIFKDQEISIPSIEDQISFATKAASALSITNSLTTTYLSKLEALGSLKQSILKQAFNGELVKE